MGPRSRYVGGPDEVMLWQDPIPEVDHALVNARDVRNLKAEILDSGISVSALVRTAWASASTFRGTDMRGGANGARIRLAPQVSWDVNGGDELANVLATLQGIQVEFNRRARAGRQVSMADLIILAGAAALERAAIDAGYDIEVPFTPGRTDASQEQTDIQSFDVLRPMADGFRNYFGEGNTRSPADMLIEKATLLTLTAPEMTALVGGMRALGANAGGAPHGLLTDRPGVLSNDFFVNLLDMTNEWTKSPTNGGIYEARNRDTGDVRWTATPVDLVFGSHAELRAIVEVYAEDGGEARFVNDFVDAWNKVMMLDRFDVVAGGAAVASR